MPDTIKKRRLTSNYSRYHFLGFIFYFCVIKSILSIHSTYFLLYGIIFTSAYPILISDQTQILYNYLIISTMLLSILSLCSVSYLSFFILSKFLLYLIYFILFYTDLSFPFIPFFVCHILIFFLHILLYIYHFCQAQSKFQPQLDWDGL